MAAKRSGAQGAARKTGADKSSAKKAGSKKTSAKKTTSKNRGSRSSTGKVVMQARASFASGTPLADLTVGQLGELMRGEIDDRIAGLVSSGRLPGGATGSHVNSGPPGFVNGGGHANFDPSDTIGAHVNSGPPGFVNGGGHANFDPSDAGGAHVNSGPPGFVNGGGHANFDPSDTLTGSHVNSGPPGFVNGGGHANFDPASQPGTNLKLPVRMTLADGMEVRLPASGPFDIRIGDLRIRR